MFSNIFRVAVKNGKLNKRNKPCNLSMSFFVSNVPECVRDIAEKNHDSIFSVKCVTTDNMMITPEILCCVSKICDNYVLIPYNVVDKNECDSRTLFFNSSGDSYFLDDIFALLCDGYDGSSYVSSDGDVIIDSVYSENKNVGQIDICMVERAIANGFNIVVIFPERYSSLSSFSFECIEKLNQGEDVVFRHGEDKIYAHVISCGDGVILCRGRVEKETMADVKDGIEYIDVFSPSRVVVHDSVLVHSGEHSGTYGTVVKPKYGIPFDESKQVYVMLDTGKLVLMSRDLLSKR